jgi:hypothetical protein
VLATPSDFTALGTAARATVTRDYDLNRVCLPAQARLINSLLPKRLALPEGPSGHLPA